MAVRLREASHRLTLSDHRFAVGQFGRLRSSLGPSANPGEAYRIMGRLPERNGCLQYRVCNDDGSHERVVTEDDLEGTSVNRTPAAP